MENFENNKQDEGKEIVGTPAILKKLAELIDAQSKDVDEKLVELSHLNEAETGFNPTPEELVEVHEGIKKQIQALGGG